MKLLAKKKLAMNNPILRNLIFNKEGTITTIIIDTATYTSLDEDGNPLPKVDEEDEFGDDEADDNNEKKKFLSDWENSQIVKKVNEIVKKYENDDFKTLISGTAVINAELKASMQRDMQKFIKIVVLIIAILLALLFRRVSGVVLPLFVVALTIISSLSLMAIFGAPITVVTQILPSFLLAVMIGASIHLLSVFFKEYNLTKDKKQALRYALSHSGLAIFMTSLTTAAGLWSFSFSELAPVADLGKFASAGVLIGLIFTLILLPALLSLIKIKPKEIIIEDDKEAHTFMDKVLVKIADISVDHPKTIIAITTVIILISLAFASNLRFSHKPIVWFDQNHPVRVATNLIDDKLKGSVTLEIIVDTNKENGLYNPNILNAMDNFSADILKIKSDKYFVGKTLSLIDIIKETNKALNNGDEKFYKIPQNRNMIAQELLLFENSGSDDLEDFVDSGFKKARITVKLPYLDAMDYMVLLKEINTKIDKNFKEFEDVNIQITGISNLLARIMEASIVSSAKSYVIAIALITIMMLILIGDIKIGLISMIPNVLPVIMTLGFMSMVGMPLDMFTMLVGAIVIGLSVDDTVHFFHNFAKYHHQGLSVKESVEKTMIGTGRALVATTIVLSLGFYVYMFASLNNLINFGILAGGAITIALFSNIILGPALLTLVSKNITKETK
jgi:predicted RND superfamily exporter protein